MEGMEEPPIIENPGRTKRLKKFVASSRFKLYCSYFLSAWGDRMWAFAMSIALGVIGGDLKYAAISGLIDALIVLLFASVVGRWVDKTQRLRAARLSLIANNTSVSISAALLVAVLFFAEQISPIWRNNGLSILLISCSIVLCACSALANEATKIVVTKDWVVVICGKDKEKLAETNAMMVRIDMTALVLSPLLAGQVMWWLGIGWGCAFIGLWNIGSFLIEYYMLWAVYESCPALAIKGGRRATGDSELLSHDPNEPPDGNPMLPPDQQPTCEEMLNRPTKRLECCSAIRNGFLSFFEAYRTYFRQSVLPAGLALALLYLTVLSFDGITTVYLLSLGMPENLIALCRGIGAVMGIVGSVIYPRLRRRVGTERTGLISLAAEWICLLLPMASVWLPGSNFDPTAVFDEGRWSEFGSPNCTIVEAFAETTVGDETYVLRHAAIAPAQCLNRTVGIQSEDVAAVFLSKCSLVTFLTGIMLSRLGLWMADLSISQAFQERTAEHERGVVNGVQCSLNNVVTIVKSVLVIILPNPRTFGILIIVSWLSVFAGFLSYCYYSRRQRGHLLPFHKQFQACMTKNGSFNVIGRSAAASGDRPVESQHASVENSKVDGT